MQVSTPPPPLFLRAISLSPRVRLPLGGGLNHQVRLVTRHFILSKQRHILHTQPGVSCVAGQLVSDPVLAPENLLPLEWGGGWGVCVWGGDRLVNARTHQREKWHIAATCSSQ